MKTRSCRCYDGPYSSETPNIFVSVRCEEHRDVPPSQGHSLMLVNAEGKVLGTQPRDKVDGNMRQKVANAKRSKQYVLNKRVNSPR